MTTMKDRDKFLDLNKRCWSCGYEWVVVYIVNPFADWIDSCPNCGERL